MGAIGQLQQAVKVKNRLTNVSSVVSHHVLVVVDARIRYFRLLRRSWHSEEFLHTQYLPTLHNYLNVS